MSLKLIKHYLAKAFGRDIAAVIFAHYIDVQRPQWCRETKEPFRAIRDDLLESTFQIHLNLSSDKWNFDRHWGLFEQNAPTRDWRAIKINTYAYRICNIERSGKWEMVQACCISNNVYYMRVICQIKGVIWDTVDHEKVYPYYRFLPGVASFYLDEKKPVLFREFAYIEGRMLRVKIYHSV